MSWTMFRFIGNVAKFYCTKVPTNENLPKLAKPPQIGKRVSVERTITDDDIIEFAKLTNDYNPIHIDQPEKIVHGALLNGLLSGVLGTKLPGPGTIVVEQLIRYPKPCYAGDTVQITVEILSARKIVKCRYSIVANSERIVLEGEGKFLMSSFRSN